MRKSFKNVFFGLGGQAIILALGILIPRLVLKEYSDEANGLLNAISQIFAYLTLIEAGIGQATIQALYRPIVEKDNKSISSIMSATQKYYRKLTWIYAVAVILFAMIYPLIINVDDKSTINFFGSTYWAVFLLILLHGISGVISFNFVAAYNQLLAADGQSYIITNLGTISQILISLTKIALINISANIVVLQFSYLTINIFIAILYRFMFKRKYAQIDFNAEPNMNALSQKNSFLVHEISGVIFSGTDVFILSIFCDLKVASIYAIYNLVFMNLKQLIGKVHGGCYYILGQSYSRDKSNYPQIYDAYDILYIALVFTLITTAYILINPFIALYTSGVSDINYVDKYLPFLFAAIQLLSCCRIAAVNLVSISGHAKATIPRTITESAINLTASIILVQFMGIYGVLLGTIIALLYRTNDYIIYSNRVILKRSPLRQYAIIGVFFLVFGITAFAFEIFKINIASYVQFIFAGLITVISLFIIYFGIAFAFNSYARNVTKELISKMFIKIKSR